MSRYVAIVFTDDDRTSSATADEILLPDREPVKTGLLNSSGVPLYRLPEPVGFRVRDDV